MAWAGSCRVPRPPSPLPRTAPIWAARWRCGASRPGTWTVTPRLDGLTQAQRGALRDTAGAAILDDGQARVLLAALAVGRKWQGDAYPGLRTRPGWAAAEAALKETGLIYSISGPDEVHVSDDIRFSLRYSDDDHIARELGGHPLPAQAVIPPARAGGAGPEACE